MRAALRSHHDWRILALVLVTVTALVAGLAVAAAQRLAPANAATAAIGPIDRSAPVSASEKSVRMLAAAQAAAQARAVVLARGRAMTVYAQAVHVQITRERIVQVARKQLGDRYSAGSSGPNAFDCSGLTRYVYRTVTGKVLPHQSHAQYGVVKKIKRSQAKPGDLVFFFRGGAHHVGIYIGNGKMIDARGYGDGVKVSPISGSWWGRTYSGMGRLLPA